MPTGTFLWTLDPTAQGGGPARRRHRPNPLLRSPQLRWLALLSPVALGVGVDVLLDKLLEGLLPEPVILPVAAGTSLALALALMGALLRSLLRSEEELAYLANYDPLTGVLNRQRFLEALRREVVRSVRRGHPCSLLFLDLDDFKAINDTLGHHWGDSVLVRAATVIREVVRTSDLVGRLGGDELAVLLPQAGAEQARAVAQRILSALAGAGDGAVPRPIGASIGIATCPTHGTTADELLAMADAAMYRAKAGGGARFCEFDSAESPVWHGGPSAVRRLQAALREGHFLLYWQPIVQLSTGRITGCEILLRLKEGGRVLTPEYFLPMAESSGIIRDIDRWVIKQAISSYHVLRRRLGGSEPLSLHINISPVTLCDQDVVAWVRDVLAATGVDARCIVLEVTETAAAADLEAMRRAMEAITALGCRFALDDFGVGYSTMLRLARLPLHVVKVDGDLTRGAKSSAIGRILVEMAVQGAKRLGLETVAEQVEENNEMLDLLRHVGFDYAQGYALGRPQPLHL